MRKIVVSKFGGTSMGDAKCISRSAEVARARGAAIVVVSATSGTTNQLIELAQVAQKQEWSLTEAAIKKLAERHFQIARDLSLPSTLTKKIEELVHELESLCRGIFYLKDCSARAMDTMMSLGERLSSVLMTHALGPKAEWVDAREIIVTDDAFGKARPQFALTAQKASARWPQIKNEDKIYVTQGFIGGTEDGLTTTLGRGGSDYSAALFAEAVQADELEIWTDVAGIATTDPRLVPAAKPIAEISFKEASELAVFGAKVLHPATLLPAMRKNIPTFVGSSFDPDSRGTWIKREVQAAPLVRAMALRKQQALVTITTPEMLNAHGFLFQIFKIFNDHMVSIDAITTSEISVSLTIDQSLLNSKKLFTDLAAIADVQVESSLCLISLIGNNINHTPGLGKKIFDSISHINVRMICLGASKHNFCFLVNEDQAVDAIQKLHQTFIERSN